MPLNIALKLIHYTICGRDLRWPIIKLTGITVTAPCPPSRLRSPPRTKDSTDTVWAWLESKGALVADLRQQLDAVELLAGRLYEGPLLTTVVAGELIGRKPQRAAAAISGLGRLDGNGRCEALNLAEAEVLVFTQTGEEPRIMMLDRESLTMHSENSRAFDESRRQQSAEVAVWTRHPLRLVPALAGVFGVRRRSR